VTEGAATPDRVAAATALRQLGHAIVGHEVEDALMARIARVAAELTVEVAGGPTRRRPVEDMKRDLFAGPPDDLESMDHFPDCVVSGLANPMGIAMRAHRNGDEAVARVALGAAFEGAPGRAHGGVVAAIFDDTMGFVLSMLRTPAFTGRLTVTYRAPTPVGEELEFRARLRERSGRKLLIDGRALRDGACFAEAEGLFIAIPIERFALDAGRPT
jgi:acyl-coenzyme A thioesterase PaaI-like protein